MCSDEPILSTLCLQNYQYCPLEMLHLHCKLHSAVSMIVISKLKQVILVIEMVWYGKCQFI